MTASTQRQPLRKVIIVNTADEGGGAERMSMATLDGFTALGIDTWLLVGDKKTDHPRVMPMYLSPFFDYRPYEKRPRYFPDKAFKRAQGWLGLEDFDHPYSRCIGDLTGSPPDLVLCHNLHGGYFDLRALGELSRLLPVVVRVFDTWLMTGHCASPLGCERWETGCGRCPDLAIPPAISHDATRFNWRRKRRMLQGARLFATAETQWMLDRLRRSLVAPAIKDMHLIPGGVDLGVFAPGPRDEARRQLGLDLRAPILLLVANLGVTNPLKDFSTVRGALAEIARGAPRQRIELLVAGAAGADERIGSNIVVRHLGYVRAPSQLAVFYRAADVFVHAAIDEPFGLSVVEAIACGVPVVTAASGGVHEVVEAGRTALVVAPRHASGLAAAILRLLEDPALRASMTANAIKARGRYDHTAMIAALHDWCARIHAEWMP